MPFGQLARPGEGTEEGEWIGKQTESIRGRADSRQLPWVFMCSVCVLLVFVTLFIIIYGMRRRQ